MSSITVSGESSIGKEMLSNYAYDAVRSAILTGWIPQGTQLIVQRLSQSLNFSPTPIKQALAALEKEGLIVSIPYRGFFVPDLSSQDVLEIFTLRESLEMTAVKLIVEQAKPEDVEALEDILREQQWDIEQQNIKSALSSTIDLDIAFHSKLAELSANRRLKDFMNNLMGPARLMMARAYSPQRRHVIAANEYKEHRQIVDAIASMNIDAAMQAIEKHCRDSCMDHLRFFHSPQKSQKNSDYFEANLDIDYSIVSEAEYEILRVNLVDVLGPLASIVCKDVVASSSSLSEAIKELKLQIPNQEQADLFEQTVKEALQ